MPSHVHSITRLPDNSDGIELWSKSVYEPELIGYPTNLVTDQNSNVYLIVDPNTSLGFFLFIYDTFGNEIGNYFYQDPRSADAVISKLVVDASGNAYTAGSSNGRYWSNFKTIKFSQPGRNSQNGKIIYDYRLDQNYPNPFIIQTQIRFELINPSPIKLKIYNCLGQTVFKKDLGLKPTGEHVFSFSKELPKGVYYYQIETGNNKKSKKMIVVK